MSVPHGWVDGRLDIAPGGADVTLADGTNATAEPLGGGHVVWRQPRSSRSPTAAGRGAAIAFLGGRPQARIADGPVTLGLRQAELLAVLALCPEGLTSEQLALALYGDRGKPVTIRAEVSRLRRVLGQTLQSRPYRLAAPVQIDFEDVERMLEAGQLARALKRYPGQLLRQSEVPLIVEARQRLDGNIRNAILASADPELLATWCAGPAGRDDHPAAELLLGLLPVDDERHPAARARAQRLRRPGTSPSCPPPGDVRRVDAEQILAFRLARSGLARRDARRPRRGGGLPGLRLRSRRRAAGRRGAPRGSRGRTTTRRSTAATSWSPTSFAERSTRSRPTTSRSTAGR